MTKVNRDILAQSNFYNALFECLGEYGVFGIMALGREWRAKEISSESDLPHFNPYTIGSYYIANDKYRRVNTFFRDFRWTVNQIVAKFGVRGKGEDEFDSSDDEFWQNISLQVRGLWESRQRDLWISLVHAIEENLDYAQGKLGVAGMRFRSVYYERGGDPERILKDNAAQQAEDKKALRIGGFRDFPVFCARWYTNSEDAWGRGWAMDALGDARALQLQQKRKAQAIDKLVDPPMVADAQLRNQRTSLISGDTTFIAPEANSIGFKPAYEIRPDLQGILEDIKETQERIKSLGYADIFAMFIQAERTSQPITAAEVNAKQQEKLLMLGPVLEQMNYDLYEPLHEWLIAEGFRHGKYPPVPKAIGKSTIRVRYTSILAQAIQQITAQSIHSFSGFVGEVLQMTAQAAQNPAADKVNFDQMIEEFGKASGVPPAIIRSDDDVKEVRQHREQMQQAQQKQEQEAQQAQNMAQHAQTAQRLSQTPTQGGQSNMLDQIASSVGAWTGGKPVSQEIRSADDLTRDPQAEPERDPPFLDIPAKTNDPKAHSKPKRSRTRQVYRAESDLREVLSTMAGIRFVSRILSEICCIDAPAFHPSNSVMSNIAGRRQVGQQIKELIREADFDLWVRVDREIEALKPRKPRSSP